ncbi:hypothetical protein J6590_018943 [Homalodisca vitripennis]|nr:hypothetical protein J6590_018943 [Homalodisca vitripennis]
MIITVEEVSSKTADNAESAPACAGRQSSSGLRLEAIKDIDLALKHGDNDIPRTKLLKRKAVLLSKLHMFEECIELVKSLCPGEEIELRYKVQGGAEELSNLNWAPW